MRSGRTGFAVVYRWRLVAGHEDAFIAAWSRLTELIRTHQRSRGSRLHRGADGLFYAYAQWPDREAWAAEWHLPPEAEELSAQMQTAVAERLEPILLTPVSDLLESEYRPAGRAGLEGNRQVGSAGAAAAGVEGQLS